MCYNKSISIILNGLEEQGYDSIIRAYVQILVLLLMMQPLFRTFCPELAGSCTLDADHLFGWRVLQIVTRKLMNNLHGIWHSRLKQSLVIIIKFPTATCHIFIDNMTQRI